MSATLHDQSQAPTDMSWRRPLHEAWSLRRLEDEYIRTVLRHTDGNRNQAARLLGIDRRTLYRRLRRMYGVPMARKDIE